MSAFRLRGQFCLFQIVTNDAAKRLHRQNAGGVLRAVPRGLSSSAISSVSSRSTISIRGTSTNRCRISAALWRYTSGNTTRSAASAPFSQVWRRSPSPTSSPTLAIKYIGRLRGGALLKAVSLRDDENTRIFFYNKLYVFSLLGETEANAELWYHCHFHKMLKKLYEYDQRHKSNNIQLLYVFLRCERNATKARPNSTCTGTT